MRRLGTDDPKDIPFSGLDDDPLGQHHMAPPSAQGAQPEVALIGDQLDDEADLVHVARQHDSGVLGFAFFSADNASELVLLDDCHFLQVPPDDFPDFSLIA